MNFLKQFFILNLSRTEETFKYTKKNQRRSFLSQEATELMMRVEEKWSWEFAIYEKRLLHTKLKLINRPFSSVEPANLCLFWGHHAARDCKECDWKLTFPRRLSLYECGTWWDRISRPRNLSGTQQHINYVGERMCSLKKERKKRKWKRSWRGEQQTQAASK